MSSRSAHIECIWDWDVRYDQARIRRSLQSVAPCASQQCRPRLGEHIVKISYVRLSLKQNTAQSSRRSQPGRLDDNGDHNPLLQTTACMWFLVEVFVRALFHVHLHILVELEPLNILHGNAFVLGNAIQGIRPALPLATEYCTTRSRYHALVCRSRQTVQNNLRMPRKYAYVNMCK